MALKIKIKSPPLSWRRQKGGKMCGRPIRNMKHDFNPAFDKLLRDADHHRINARLPYSALFPPYYGTRLEREVKDAKNRAKARNERDN